MGTTLQASQPSKSTTTRLVYRHGLELVIRDDGRWTLPSVEAASADEVAKAVAACGPEPLIAEQLLPFGERQISLLLARRMPFGIRKTWLKQRFLSSPEHGGVCLGWLEVDYLLGAIAYHCERMAEEYARVRKAFVQIDAIPGSNSPARRRSHFAGASDSIWYELDALLSAARRTLDLSRFVIWERGGNKGTCPRNFIRTLGAASLPSPLRLRLQSLWDEYGARLTEYRDCIQHNSGLSQLHGGVVVDNREYGVWLVTAALPDNPEAKSPRQFTYSKGIDALDYAYSVVVEWMDAMEAVGRHLKPHPTFDAR